MVFGLSLRLQERREEGERPSKLRLRAGRRLVSGNGVVEAVVSRNGHGNRHE